MNRAARLTLLTLAVLAVAFAATWMTMPNHRRDKVEPPASFFARGLTEPGSRNYRPYVDVDALERRVLIMFGVAASVVVLVGLAFGAARAPKSP